MITLLAVVFTLASCCFAWALVDEGIKATEHNIILRVGVVLLAIATGAIVPYAIVDTLRSGD